MAVSYISRMDSSASSSSVTCAQPSGVTDGDILVAYVTAFRATNLAPGTITAPARWTEWGQRRTSSYHRSAIFWKRANSESGNYTFTSSSATKMQISIFLYRGCIASGDPAFNVSNTAYTTSNTIVRAAPLTIAFVGSAIHWCGFFYFSSGSPTLTVPSGFTSRTASDNGTYAYAAGNILNASPGSTGNMDGTASATASIKHAFAVHLLPEDPFVTLSENVPVPSYTVYTTEQLQPGITVSVPIPDYTNKFRIGNLHNLSGAILHDNTGNTDYTAEASEDTPNDFPLLPNSLSGGDGFYYLLDSIPNADLIGLFVRVGTMGAGAWATSVYYWNGSDWISLGNYLKSTSPDFKEYAGYNIIVFEPPPNWAQTTILGRTGYGIFSIVTTYSSKTTIPLGTRIYYAPIHIYISDTNTTVFNVRTTLEDSTQLEFNIRLAFDDSVIILFNTRQIVTDTVQLLYHIRQVITDSIQSIYNIRETISNTITINWNVLKIIIDASTPTWNVRATLQDDLELLWNVLPPISGHYHVFTIPGPIEWRHYPHHIFVSPNIPDYTKLQPIPNPIRFINYLGEDPIEKDD